MSPATHFAWSPAELKRILAADRAGEPFLLWRDGSGAQRLFKLAGVTHATIGRRSSNDIALANDSEVSRSHAVLDLIGGDWTVADDGLSRNGTFVRGARISHRQRLADGDLMRFGQTVVEYHRPGQGATAVTAVGSSSAVVEQLSDVQQRILTALCRPCFPSRPVATPATNAEVAAEVFLGVDAVKKHLRSLYARFGLAELPQNQKRAQLAQAAIERGLVSKDA